MDKKSRRTLVGTQTADAWDMRPYLRKGAMVGTDVPSVRDKGNEYESRLGH
jgi:hypothetical protein